MTECQYMAIDLQRQMENGIIMWSYEWGAMKQVISIVKCSNICNATVMRAMQDMECIKSTLICLVPFANCNWIIWAVSAFANN